ncbi:MAG: hypothetical protein ACRESZ_14300, partial [Methylococcales bacterium]
MENFSGSGTGAVGQDFYSTLSPGGMATLLTDRAREMLDAASQPATRKPGKSVGVVCHAIRNRALDWLFSDVPAG